MGKSMGSRLSIIPKGRFVSLYIFQDLLLEWILDAVQCILFQMMPCV